MADNFSNALPGLDSPASGVYVPTPADNSDLPIASRAIRASGAGNVVIIGVDGQTCTCAFLAGETRAIRAARIKVTGTTATGLEVMY